jgi:hypothetical protein
MPSGVGLLKGNFSPNLQFIILPQLAGFGKGNFSKNKVFLPPYSGLAAKPRLTKDLLGTLPKGPFGRAIITSAADICAKKLGCGQEGGEERITAARGHRSNFFTPTSIISSAQLI